ncbi:MULTISPECIES: WhiB family transcriptional regulator [unclassified Rhodococcus (in: high G+C Gram-positive bacteria)]|uniref:WhiB family transcriptional regulator n=1 Tax=unclassified Rhodococcus (in: high G+C Gram-positive bacteria) TaxID=192944 RepID=UPI0028998EF7|nr:MULTISPECIES: WhiB family transcriptional regulator [unclassified Rhodococcus (in: high G+C Gram-positive bacteria)]
MPNDTTAPSARESRDWWRRAACRGAETSMFFSPEGERGSARVRREAQARRICQACPVVEPCRRHALTSGEPYGVWGGTTESDRRKNSRRRDWPLRAGEPSRP